MQNNQKNKNCPFCGAPGQIEWNDDGNGGGSAYIECTECSARGDRASYQYSPVIQSSPDKCEELAWKYWNNRYAEK